ncbi:MurR/RpiR family transcriptional regulator [Amycolatopsis sp. NPDC088138]|uniref:MurR/RpiR family transcriptional regulator n=1 Tax=Amycolatopsis sp. NPDC088138 TaxID=3363938 RepID=UPI003816AD50
MDTTDLSLQDRITGRLALLTAAERKVAEYLRNHGPDAIFATAGQIAAAAGTSDATVVRTARSLGYSGLLELRHSLTRQVVRATAPAPPSSQDSLLSHVFAEATQRLADTLRLTTEAAFGEAVDVLAEAREVLAFGIGPSETVAGYLALRLRRIGRRARATGATGFRLADDLLDLAGGDVVVLYSPSRLLAEIDVVLDHAAAVGARAVLISDSLGPVFADRVHVALSAAHTPTGATGEGLPSQVLTDALVLGVRAKDEARATERAELLTELRTELSQTGGRRPRTPHRKENP